MMKQYPFNKEPNDDKESKYYLLLIIGIIILSLVILFNFPSQAQTITTNYSKGLRIRIDNSNPNELKPCFVFFPGGGFISQNWAICNTWSEIAVSQGYVSCKVGYSTTFLFPTLSAANKGIIDCMNSIKWIKLHAKTYGIDTNKIYLAGTSAGGFCAMGCYQYKVNIAGILNGWGAVLNLSYLSQMNIPVYNVSTDIDKIVPVGCATAFGVPCCGSSAINNELILRGIKTDWLVWEGYKHGLAPKDSEYNNRVNNSFLKALQFFK